VLKEEGSLLNRKCPKCNNVMESETRPILKSIPLPMPFAPEIPIEQYLPDLVKKHSNYTIFVCNTCGYLEVFIT